MSPLKLPKLHILTASESDRVLILRRGPRGWYHLILWETRKDAFTHGAWFKGRIYEDRCALSPDGRLLVYFVLKGNRSGTDVTHAWTALSRPPWLYALALWPQGTTYGGGGVFTGNRSLSVNYFNRELTGNDLSSLNIENHPIGRAHVEPVVENSDWSGTDCRGSAIFTRGYQLFRRKKKTLELLADFADLEPDPQEAPSWAKRRL